MNQFISGPEAAQLAQVTITTIHAWCKKYGIGNKVGGRWRINPEKLNRLLKGEMKNGRKENR